jgi:D-serine deaminase-like pyridoxal phosphate-dependent protein
VVALQQMRRGAIGQCVQKVSEAEALAWGGVPDILVSNQVIAPRKLARLAALSSIAKVAVCARLAAANAAPVWATTVSTTARFKPTALAAKVDRPALPVMPKKSRLLLSFASIIFKSPRVKKTTHRVER